MKLLLDTHTALWWLADDGRLGEEARRVLADPANEVLLSAVVSWEIATKRALGKLRAPAGLADVLLGGGARELPVTIAHAASVERLPAHHADPFDRLLIVQAQAEGAVIVTRDPAFDLYGVATVW